MNLKIDMDVDFYPIGGALHQAQGVILGFDREEGSGKRLVKIHATHGDGKGRNFYVYPSDIIRVLQLKKP